PYYSCWSCPIPGCVGSTHTPSVENVLGSTGGWSTGPPSDPFAYMSYQTTTSAPEPAGQGGIGSATDASVVCSVVGTIFNPPPFQGEIAYTRADWSGTPPPTCRQLPNSGFWKCTYPVANNCTAASTPPDNDFTGSAIGDADYRGIATYLSFMTVAPCYRFAVSGKWTCLHGLAFLQGLNGTPFPPFTCTHNP
ncbi:MAG: hypothetical protein ACHP8A_13615, partial [Terriglobales bacterium]